MAENCIQVTYFDEQGNPTESVNHDPGSPPHVVVHPHSGLRVRIVNTCSHAIEVWRHENGGSLGTVEAGKMEDFHL